MKTYRVETTVSNEGTLTIEIVPFPAGDRVEVVVRRCEGRPTSGERYPLRGQPIRYTAPFDSVAEAEWGVLK
jgi:hypothetical protein